MDNYKKVVEAGGMAPEKADIKKVFICGGTGFLGYYSALEFLNQGIAVDTLSLPDIKLGDWFDKRIGVKYGNLFEMKKEELSKYFEGCDALVYAVGPDDRVHTPPGVSGYDFFHEKLVDKVIPVFEAAKEAGVKKGILLNSYFAYFDRTYPERKLGENHPYIKVRGEQAKALIEVGGGQANGGMDVISLELPYIFGNMPEREPLWKDIFLDRFANMPAVMFPKGGTNMIHVTGVAQAVVASTLYAVHGDRLPIGAVDETYKYMINKMMEEVGSTKRYMGVPCWMATLGGYMVANGLKKTNQESGLNYKRLMKDIQSKNYYFADECALVRKYLHYDELGFDGGMKSFDKGFHETIIACYPHRFDADGKLLDKYRGVNPIKAETATNNVFYNKEHKEN